jgi:hypothetical protein
VKRHNDDVTHNDADVPKENRKGNQPIHSSASTHNMMDIEHKYDTGDDGTNGF